jgi:hypothetical protein
MSNMWSTIETQKISSEFAKVVSNEFFKDKNLISGSEIINLTEIKQLNLFIIKELYGKWKEELAKIKSPYFDYESQEVKKALDDFMNVLSRNISVNKENFESLLNSATQNTLLMFNDPKQYFNEEMRNLPNFKLEKEWLQEVGKFYVDYNWLLREMLSRLNGLQFVYANEAIDWINDLIIPETIEDHNKCMNEIIKISGVNVSNKSSNQGSNSSFFDSLNSISDQKTSERLVNTIKNQEGYFAPESLVSETIKMEAPSIVSEVSKSKQEKSESFIKLDENITLHQKMQENNESSLSDFHQKRKIDSLKGNISLNQKFLFTNNLFGGNSEIFTNAIIELEDCNNFSEAKEQMLKKYLPQFKWDLSSPEAEEFFDLLKRRFN